MIPSRLRDWSLHLSARIPSPIPCACALCGDTGDRPICADCRARHFGTRVHRCIRCAAILPDENARECGECINAPPAFDASVVASDYAAPADQLVLALKFGGRLALAPVFADMLRDAMLRQNIAALPAVLTAVPLGSKRLAERGFNQALEIARPLSRALGIGLERRLAIRTRETGAQSLLPPDQRRKNMRHAFSVPGDAIEKVRGRHVGVVDDVITTGATLNELAATLKHYGATRVTNLVFARTPH